MAVCIATWGRLSDEVPWGLQRNSGEWAGVQPDALREDHRAVACIAAWRTLFSGRDARLCLLARARKVGSKPVLIDECPTAL